MKTDEFIYYVETMDIFKLEELINKGVLDQEEQRLAIKEYAKKRVLLKEIGRELE